MTSPILHCHTLKSGLADFVGSQWGMHGPHAPAPFLVATEPLSWVAGQWVSEGHGLEPLRASLGVFLPGMEGGSSDGGWALILLTQGPPPPPQPGNLLGRPPPGLKGLAVPHPPCGLGPGGEEGFCLLDYPGEKWGLGSGIEGVCSMRRPALALLCYFLPPPCTVGSPGKTHWKTPCARLWFGNLCGAVSH